jgi:hypothetical protein
MITATCLREWSVIDHVLDSSESVIRSAASACTKHQKFILMVHVTAGADDAEAWPWPNDSINTLAERANAALVITVFDPIERPRNTKPNSQMNPPPVSL